MQTESKQSDLYKFNTDRNESLAADGGMDLMSAFTEHDLPRTLSNDGAELEANRRVNGGFATNINCCLRLASVPTIQELRAQMLRLAGTSGRWTNTISVNEDGFFAWTKLDRFDINEYISLKELDDTEIGQKAALERELVPIAISGPMEGRAMWKSTLFTYKSSKKCDLVITMSHAIGDGHALVNAVFKACDPYVPKREDAGKRTSVSISKPTREKKVFRRLRQPDNAIANAAHRFWKVATLCCEILNCTRIFMDTPSSASMSEEFAKEYYDLESAGERLAYTRDRGLLHVDILEYGLPEMKRVCHYYGVTLNELLTSLFAGQVARFNKWKGTPAPKNCKLVFTINQRARRDPDGTAGEYRNLSGMAFLSVNADPQIDAAARLQHTQWAISDLSNSQMSLAIEKAFQGGDQHAEALLEKYRGMQEKMLGPISHGLLTNVKGPSTLLMFGNQKIESIFGVVGSDFAPYPVFASVSYCDRVTYTSGVGFLNREDKTKYDECFREELEELAAGMEQGAEPIYRGGCQKGLYILLIPFSCLSFALEGSCILLAIVLGLVFGLLKCLWTVLTLNGLLCPCLRKPPAEPSTAATGTRPHEETEMAEAEMAGADTIVEGA